MMHSLDYCKDSHIWEVPNITSLYDIDSKLRDFEKDIRRRYAIFEKTKRSIEEAEGLDRFTQGYKELGVCVMPDGGVLCREWIPNARSVYLSGDFNNWEKWMYVRKAYGKWELFINSDADGLCAIPHLSELKLWVETENGQMHSRISPWAKYVEKRDDESKARWLFWNPPRNEVAIPLNMRPPKPLRLRIYEAHVGATSSSGSASNYQHFTEEVLPRIRDQGYNCVLLMAIMDQPDNTSCDYNILNFFAASSRYGTPSDLKRLIDTAHGMGMTVLMDVGHIHALRHFNKELNMFDEDMDNCYFQNLNWQHHGEKSAMQFDLTKWEVLRFLLSNLRYYMDEYNLDGFRFNEATSMLYHNPQENSSYSNDYRQYFGMHVNMNVISYLMLANDIIHSYYPTAITIVEDTSEMPTLCRPVREGGIGFDYKLGMSIPNKWMKLIEETRDENWNMGFIFHTMVEKRSQEKVISCAETRQQCMVEKKTLIGQLLGYEIHENMSENKPLTLGVDRGLSLHKMIRLMTHSLAGDSYINFMGNEFGHPDLVEFPNLNNNFRFCRRRYDFANNDDFRFKYLNRFDKAMNCLEETFGWLMASPAFVSRKHEEDKIFVYERAQLLFLFNFHPTKSFPDYKVGVDQPGIYKIVLDSDDVYYGGHGRNLLSTEFHTKSERFDNRSNSLMVYLPSRCALVMATVDHNQPMERVPVTSGRAEEFCFEQSTPYHW